MQSENIDIKLLQPNTGQIEGLPKNPRLIKDDRFKQLVKSIQDDPEMMDLRECIVYPQNGHFVVIAGNMRLQACKHLKYDQVPCKILPIETSIQKLKAYTIKDNIPFGENDFDLLANEWNTDELLDWGMELPDFKNNDVHKDDYEIPDEIQTDIVAGDLFEIGQHRLLCGDSTKANDVAKLMNGNKADMVFIDPPYAVKYGKDQQELQKKSGGKFSKTRKFSKIAGDMLSTEECAKLIWKPSFKNLYEFANDDCSFYMTMCQGGDQMMMMMMSEHFQIKHELIWVKSSQVFSMGRLDYDYKHEPILFGWKKRHKFYAKGEFVNSVWEIPKPTRNDDHPTMKPVKLVANALLNSSKERNIIIDFFEGSGTTMIACHQLNRIHYALEIEPIYCQVIIDRMLKLDSSLIITKNGKPFKISVKAA